MVNVDGIILLITSADDWAKIIYRVKGPEHVAKVGISTTAPNMALCSYVLK